MDLVKYLNKNEKIRNICILAHVDHGKTTLVDNLISSNKIISEKNIGKVKYMDNREDEQKRQITMKSSSILLECTYNKNYVTEMFSNTTIFAEKKINENDETNMPTEKSINPRNEKTTKGDNPSSIPPKESNEEKDGITKNSIDENMYLINIIDTPGHVDFSSEVSTCVRICDGALILIDCIEGLCSQTKIVLRQTWKEMVKCILVINKIDKLITNKNMDSVDAYEHINNIIENVNAYIYQLYMEQNMDTEDINNTIELEKYTFSTLKGNVLLCSSIHCWCVDMNIFTYLFCKKMNIDINNCNKIKKYMWNRYYFNIKEKKILKIPNDTNILPSGGGTNTVKKKKKNLFSLVVLDFLWRIYDITITNRDDEKIKKLCTELNISDQFLQNSKFKQNNNENNVFILTTIMSNFLSLSRSIFNACIEIFPSSNNISESRLFKIYPSLYNNPIYKNMLNCASDQTFTIIYISKNICANIQNNTIVGFKDFHGQNTFLSICKIYSGTIYENMVLYVCGKNIQTRINKIYICMGGDLLPIKQAYAGNIVAIYLSIKNEHIYNFNNVPSDYNINHSTYENSDHKCEIKSEIINKSECTTSYEYNKIKDSVKNSGIMYSQENENTTDPNGQWDLQYLSNTVINLIKNKKNNKEHNIFLMNNNDGIFLNKNITLSNKKNVDSFILSYSDTCSTILHTIIEPQNIQDMNKFLRGLILLYTCDTSIDIDFNQRGEYILKFCGEIHMQKCLSDFVNIYSNIEIKTSDTNISIREGICNYNIKVKKKKNIVHDNMKQLHSYYEAVQKTTLSKQNEDNNITQENGKEKFKNLLNTDNTNMNKECKNHQNIHSNNNDTLISSTPFKHIHIEKDNVFLNILFNYSNNIISTKLNNNSFYIFLSVLNMPEKMIHFFDKHYSSIQAILENRGISSTFLNYSKNTFSGKNEDFMYKQCLINLEKCINDIFFSDNFNCETFTGENESPLDETKKAKTEMHQISYFENSEHKENNNGFAQNIKKTEPITKDDYQTNFLKKNKTYQLQLWDICVQNGSITLLCIKKYLNKKKDNNEYIYDNIITNEEYKNAINQRSLIDTYISENNSDINIYLNNLCLGFKLASKYGPIAQEPIRGVIFIIEGLIIDEKCTDTPFEYSNLKRETVEEEDDTSGSTGSNKDEENKINTGNIIGLMKDACLTSMQQSKLRIFEPMLRLNLTCESNVLGKVYNVLLKRRCSILSEEIKDGYFLYFIDAYLPLFNSFKLAEELRSKCSGNVIYDIQFSHWNKLDEDIFLLNDSSAIIYDEDFDTKVTYNTSTEIVNYIRRAKGLETNEKIIQKPEKQCTLKK
ncbi:elongation factor Tu, putative [Plasmodium berghei]|uniref:Elongation factor Tu, putative n=2 Tax=Plasmodium berghei TaxID=5821 RepID=A0A509AYH5_PLABA|nr:elongation factor Tu, putative [Plasmodium berghei ANKA]CXJ04785.1 elongation factor Tu, putative [Plasmodium berghei]SCL98725.1 elongation factor Tu, putative [Plasmodium berghei]SCM16884.1 elongation factor Tu, putative [Plasmodium berghei]SCM18682.1 elongation factor Tu, putative [Plasmodium berghei]SCN28117.1 elongation factor Tu, putative [Plasmodium berghei]|eukprot:XP_034423767.1 elongation factor Tu, putative [Plasmodium berghei ANKA]